MKELSLSTLKSGADLMHPKVTPGWAIGAIGGVVMLLAAVSIGKYLFAMGSEKIQPATASAVESVSEIMD